MLIITYYWPPAGGSGVQRWLKFAKYLPDFGIEPVVYTVKDPNYAFTDESLLSDVRKEQEVLRGPIWEPNDLLKLVSGSKKQASAGFLDPNPGLIEKALRYVRANFFIPDSRKYWVKPSVKFLSTYLKENKVDALITTGPPHSVHLIGRALKQRFGICWIADFRDPWTRIDYFHALPLTGASRKKHAHLERKVLEESDGVVVVGPSMKTDFSAWNKEVHVIPNGYDDYRSAKRPVLDEKFTLTHVGLMNADRNPVALWRVLAELIESDPGFAADLRIQLVGECAGEVVQSLREFGLEDLTLMTGYQPHEQVMEYQLSAQVLLLSVNKVPSARSLVTGKVFEYLQARRPILAIGPPDGDLAAIVKKTGSGEVVDFENEARLKAVIKEWYQNYKDNALNVDPKGVEQYHRRSLARDMSELIRHLKGGELKDDRKSSDHSRTERK